MTNGELYKSPSEREKAFYGFCDSYGDDCGACPLFNRHCVPEHGIMAAFAWLDLEAARRG